ncbi:MFS transporter [Amycolatopsis acidicola]|uniref:MFS transporter n=1 Tax=Amycolatopsis acidicola TaxID=2596893 RepID=A0A5N0VGV7_9PSEU|nr:MFS transporter [Amycolatopsis acidicola]KAA9164061.1 MFS transporter [Amycolatopsis acidicola]
MPGRSSAAASLAVVVTCVAITSLDGMDLSLLAAVLPDMLEIKQWGMTAIEAGLVGSLSLVGMMVGATGAGYLSDIVGRRPTGLACIACFSVFTGLCALAPNLPVFAVLRLLAGLGFGGALPTAIALTMEYVRRERRQLYNGVIQTGFPLGGVLIAVLAIFAVPAFGWRALFAFAGLVGVVLFVVAYRVLPESLVFLVSRQRTDEAARMAEKYAVDSKAESAQALRSKEKVDGLGGTAAIRSLFRPGFRAATVLFPLCSFCGLLVAYGMNTWIPQILKASGYAFGSALVFLVAFHSGAAVGMVVLSGLSDRFGPRVIIPAGFVLGAIGVSVVSFHPAQAVVLVLMVLTGFCSSSQTALSGFTGVYYPPSMRGTAIGLALGVGRLGGVLGPILVGAIVGAGMGVAWVFYAFAVVGLLAAALVVAVPRSGIAGLPAPHVLDAGEASTTR